MTSWKTVLPNFHMKQKPAMTDSQKSADVHQKLLKLVFLMELVLGLGVFLDFKEWKLKNSNKYLVRQFWIYDRNVILDICWNYKQNFHCHHINQQVNKITKKWNIKEPWMTTGEIT